MQDSNTLESPNKNGYVQSLEVTEGDGRYPTHCSALFYRRESVFSVKGQRIAVPQELPLGIQLRNSAILLLHSVVVSDTELFFSAESTTAVGNIRPHIVSLLFRSLASAPRSCVVAAHRALKEILSLSLNPTEEGKNQSQLPKELLQRCIRPVLLNLRDFTMLSIPLLRGLSRLLLLLNSWFNKTLGEKLLDHLQKWTDPARIMALSLRPGQETKIAASAVGIFCLLPHASQFTELLVKTCIKLEAALPGFKNHEVSSPFRQPLARFLDKYPQEAVAFFFPRLKTPIYSELFQNIVRLDECRNLRSFLGNRSSSLMILNRCFERPLAIMRAERGSAPGGSVRHSLSVHGIGKNAVEQPGPDKTRPMDVESLELQFQGFTLISSLHEHDPNYLRSHNDIVRALRWLWRSKGRYLRLQHESQIPPRFHTESSMLAKFLMSYAEQFPNDDVGVLFELILVFLHTSTVDFDGVARFLNYMVCDVLEVSQKKQVLSRFFEMIGGDSNEETKVLTVQFIIYPLLKADLAVLSEPNDDGTQLVDEGMMKLFVETALLKDGLPIICGDRLRVELLKLADLFISKVPSYVKPFQREYVNSIWSQMKLDDSTCKSWAYVVACRLVATFDVSPKPIMQVYSALLRSHHQEDKELVRFALDLLIPTLPSCLSAQQFKKAVEEISQMMLEEASSTPQLAHLCQTVLRDGGLFYPYWKLFVEHLISSVSRLALPPNSPHENRLLAVEIVALLLNWSKKSVKEEFFKEDHLLSIVNNLIRLKMLLTEAVDGRAVKVEHGQTSLDRMITRLLKEILKDSKVSIWSQPFEKIASRDKLRAADYPSLASSLELFALIADAGIQDFFDENCQLVSATVDRGFEVAATDSAVRNKLVNFVVIGGQTDHTGSLIAVSLERVLLEFAHHPKRFSSNRTADASPRSPSRGRDRQGVEETDTSVSYLVDILQALNELCSNGGTIHTLLTSSLLTLGSSMSKHHIAEASAKQRQGFSMSSRSGTLGIPYSTPTVGILEAALQQDFTDFARLQPMRHRSGKEGNASSGPSDYVKSLVLILAILERKGLPTTFTVERKLLVQLLGILLDGSDSVQLLCLCTRIIGNWLISGSGSSPLTVKEKHSFLWRLSSFDWKLLPDDLSSQPLADLVLLMVQKLPPTFGDGDDLVYVRALVACLLNANAASRKQVLKMYLQSTVSTCDPVYAPVAGLSHFDVLWRLLHSDFEGIASRHWIVVVRTCAHARFLVCLLFVSLTPLMRSVCRGIT
jgi:transformation/transcription domain-associated protein